MILVLTLDMYVSFRIEMGSGFDLGFEHPSCRSVGTPVVDSGSKYDASRYLGGGPFKSPRPTVDGRNPAPLGNHAGTRTFVGMYRNIVSF